MRAMSSMSEPIEAGEVDRRTRSSKYALEHAADAAASCKGRNPEDVVDDAVRVGDTGSHEVWQLHEALPAGSDARDTASAAYSAAVDGTTALKAAAVEVEDAEHHYDEAWSHFQRALRTLGW